MAYKAKAEEYISPKDMDLPVIVKVRGAKTFEKSFAHYLPQVGYQDCVVQFKNRKKIPGTCPHCDKKIPSRARFTWDVFVKRNGKWDPVLIRMNTTSHKKMVEVVAALSLTGREFDESPLALTIGTNKKYGYKYYKFQLHEDEQPTSSQAVDMSKPSAFGDADEDPDLTAETDDNLMTATDELILAKNADYIFDPDKTWNHTKMATAFYMELKQDPYNIDDEVHASQVAQYVLDHFDELKKEYTPAE